MIEEIEMLNNIEEEDNDILFEEVNIGELFVLLYQDTYLNESPLYLKIDSSWCSENNCRNCVDLDAGEMIFISRDTEVVIIEIAGDISQSFLG